MEEVTQQQQSTPENIASENPGTPLAEGAQQANKNANLLIVVVLAVIVVILALMYLWGQATSELPAVPDELDVLMDSDAVDVLEQDLAVPDLDAVDADLNELEASLDAELQQL